MPKLLNSDMDNMVIVPKGDFNFSAIKMESLGATEYTLVTIACDVSGSVDSYKSDLLKAIKSVVNACKKSPRAENLLLRIIQFNKIVSEVHGFKLLNMINVDTDYNEPLCTGSTSLNDAVYSSIGATLVYAKKLIDQDFNANGICFIITDGEENSSRTTTTMIKDLIRKSKVGEQIESLVTILIGINNTSCASTQQAYQQDSGLTQFVDVGDATSQKLAKLAAFVSKSISSQSQSLGSGGPSQPLTF